MIIIIQKHTYELRLKKKQPYSYILVKVVFSLGYPCNSASSAPNARCNSITLKSKLIFSMMPIRLLINSVTGDILAIIGINITGGHLILSFK